MNIIKSFLIAIFCLFAVSAASSASETRIGEKIAAADVENGARLLNLCKSCHTFSADGAIKIGPPVYDIIGSGFAQNPDFSYSDAFVKLREAGRVWTFENLYEFLLNPRGAVPDTKMRFSGVSQPDDVADVVAYLRILSQSPLPLPQ